MLSLRTLLPLLLLLLLFLPAAAGAEAVHEERFVLRHQSPETILKRLELLHGTSTLNAKGVEFLPEGRRTLVMKVPERYGDAFARSELHFTAQRLVQLLDSPEPPVEISMYVVRTSVLTEQQFLTLDRRLREGPLDLPAGTLARGVVLAHRAESPNLEVYRFSKAQEEARASTHPGRVEARGRILPSAVTADGLIRVATELDIQGLDEPLTREGGTVRVAGRSSLRPVQPQIIVAGEERPLRPGPGDESRPAARHEIMVYVWVRPLESPAAGR